MAQQQPQQQWTEEQLREYDQRQAYKYTPRASVPRQSKGLPKSSRNFLIVLGAVVVLLLVIALYFSLKEETVVPRPAEEVPSIETGEVEIEEPPLEQAPFMVVWGPDDVFTEETKKVLSESLVNEDNFTQQEAENVYDAMELFVRGAEDGSVPPELATSVTKDFFIEEYMLYKHYGSTDAIVKMITLDGTSYKEKVTNPLLRLPEEAITHLDTSTPYLAEGDLELSDDGQLVVQEGESINITVLKTILGEDVTEILAYRIVYGPVGEVIPYLGIEPANLTIEDADAPEALIAPVIFTEFLPRGHYVFENSLTDPATGQGRIDRLPIFYEKEFHITKIMLAYNPSPTDLLYDDEVLPFYFAEYADSAVYSFTGAKSVKDGTYSVDVTGTLVIFDSKGDEVLRNDSIRIIADGLDSFDKFPMIQKLDNILDSGNYTIVLEITDNIRGQTSSQQYSFTIFSQDQQSEMIEAVSRYLDEVSEQ